MYSEITGLELQTENWQIRTFSAHSGGTLVGVQLAFTSRVTRCATSKPSESETAKWNSEVARCGTCWRIVGEHCVALRRFYEPRDEVCDLTSKVI